MAGVKENGVDQQNQSANKVRVFNIKSTDVMSG